MTPLPRILTRLLLGLLLLATLTAHSASADEGYLPVDQAFGVNAGIVPADGDQPERLQLHWTIAQGYYLYRDKLTVSSQGEAFALGQVQLPPTEIRNDPNFGETAIYRSDFTAEWPLERTETHAAPNHLTLKVKSQGCAEAGFCYPPREQILEVALPSAAPTLTPRELLIGRERMPNAEEAFDCTASVADARHLALRCAIAPGTYLYAERFELTLDAPGNGAALGDYRLPEPTRRDDAIRADGSTGPVEIYQDEIALNVPVARFTREATEATLAIGYQGCAELGLCYPPQTRHIDLQFPALATTEPVDTPLDTPAHTSPSDLAGEHERIAALLAGGNLPLTLAAFFGFGLLLAFTPCIFPMIPILSGIIVGQGAQLTTARAFTLSLTYVLAMALTYTLAGILAGLLGANLQALFQNPWVLGAFAAIFVLLALSMFGFYELQLPAALQTRASEASNRQRGGTLLGVAVMGVLSALIVGPCLAPPLLGALIYIGHSGDAVLGGLALFALALGMGVPLIVIGTSAGKLLPRAGAWMDRVKAVFGVILLAIAIWLLERVLPPALAMLLWGLLLICSGVFMGALRPAPQHTGGWHRDGWHHLWQGLGLALLIYGALMLIGTAAGSKHTLQPLRGLFASGGAEATSIAFRPVGSIADLERELGRASANSQPALLDLYADWCVSCKELERKTFGDPTVRDALSGLVLLRANLTANTAEHRALLRDHLNLPGPPALLFYDHDGRERRELRRVGFIEPQALLDVLAQVAP